MTRLTPIERERYKLGRACYEQGNFDKGLEVLLVLLESRKDLADVHYMVGVMQEREGDLESASHSLWTAIRINPSYAEALLALAAIQERLGDYDRSEKLAERAARVTHTPGTIDATTRGKLANLQAVLADAYAEVGDYREAIQGYRKALDRCPNFHDIRHRLGKTLRDAGLPHQAELEFKRVLRANATFLEARVQLGLTYYTTGRTQEALAEWSTVLAEDPAREDARMYLKLVENPS